MLKLKFAALGCYLLSVWSCVVVTRPYDQLPPGSWHAELSLSEDVVLPFNMETTYDDDQKLSLYVINGDERIKIPDIKFGRDKQLRDTVYIDFPLMDSHIKAVYKENVMEGTWTVRNREDYHVPFVAYHGQDFRFSHNATPPVTDITGNWRTTFAVETPDAYPAIGEFITKRNQVTGTFRTETGDYRYLAGEIQGEQLKLSCFDGAHAFLFTATVQNDSTLIGKFYSGAHYSTNWVAIKDENATLTDAFQLTQEKVKNQKITLELPNSKGQLISLDAPTYAGKPKLIKVMGTWCPNCLDESRFIKEYLKSHPDLEVEVLAIAFEKYKDPQKAKEIIANYKERLDIPYEILYGGYYSKSIATDVLGVVDKIISYPTLLFVNSDNTISSIYTGFSGPATSGYDEFKAEFQKEIDKITKK